MEWVACESVVFSEWNDYAVETVAAKLFQDSDKVPMQESFELLEHAEDSRRFTDVLALFQEFESNPFAEVQTMSGDCVKHHQICTLVEAIDNHNVLDFTPWIRLAFIPGLFHGFAATRPPLVTN
jgi:hypothetical protein